MEKFLYHPAHATLVARLKRERLGAGKTQEELAELLRSRQAFVSKVEAGQRRIDLVELAQICDALRLDLGRGGGGVLSRLEEGSSGASVRSRCGSLWRQ